eukprot:482738_1
MLSSPSQNTFIQLKPPPEITHSIPTPVYYAKNHCIYISTDSEESNPGIWKYELNSLSITNSHDYSGDLDFVQICNPECCIDVENSDIYISGNVNHCPVFFGYLDAFNIINEQWRVCVGDGDDEYILRSLSTITFIPHPINQLHVFADGNHYKYKEELVLLSENIGYNGRPKLFYSKLTNQLLLFQSKVDYILICNIYSSEQTEFVWSKIVIKLPQKLGYQYAVILAWNHVVFCIDFNVCTIWILDLLHMEQKWMKAVVDFPKKQFTNAHAFRDKYDNLHLMQFRDSRFHYRICLYDIIPIELITVNRASSNPHAKSTKIEGLCQFVWVIIMM